MIGIIAVLAKVVIITAMALKYSQIILTLNAYAHDGLVTLARHRAEVAKTHLDELLFDRHESFSEQSNLQLPVKGEL